MAPGGGRELNARLGGMATARARPAVLSDATVFLIVNVGVKVFVSLGEEGVGRFETCIST